MLKLNHNNGIERNYYGISQQLVELLNTNDLYICYDDINEKFSVYSNKDGYERSDMTVEELERELIEDFT